MVSLSGGTLFPVFMLKSNFFSMKNPLWWDIFSDMTPDTIVRSMSLNKTKVNKTKVNFICSIINQYDKTGKHPRHVSKACTIFVTFIPYSISTFHYFGKCHHLIVREPNLSSQLNLRFGINPVCTVFCKCSMILLLSRSHYTCHSCSNVNWRNW